MAESRTPRRRGPSPSDPEREVLTLHAGLDALSYYEFLGVGSGADYLMIREAFHRRAQRFHPDRFLMSADPALRRAAYAVYKRIAEAYNVLIDPQLRMAYDEAHRAGRVRLEDVGRTRRLSPQERQLSNPFARVYIRSAQRKLDAGRRNAAWIDAKLGLSLEDAPALRLLLESIERSSS